MSTTMSRIQTLVRAQTALSRIELRCKVTQASYAAGAGLLALIALGMLNVAAFLGLNEVVAPYWSALILAMLDALLAVVLVKTASGVQPGPEADIAKEVRDMLLADLAADAQSVRDEIEQVRTDVQRIRVGFAGFSGGLPVGLGSLIELLTKSLRRSKKKGS